MNPAEFANIARAERDLWWYRGQRRILFRILDPFLTGRRIERVLEAGCGTGYFSGVLRDRYGWRMTPLDLGAEGLAYARQAGIERLTQADIAHLPYRAGSFDAVVSMDVLVHFPPGEEARPAAELARVLRPGGLLVLRVSALDLLRSRHSEFAQERQRFTAVRLRTLMEAQGIRVLRLTCANTLLLPVALFKFRVWEPLLRRPPASGVEPVPAWLDSLLHAPLALEASLTGAGIDLPLGQSLILIGEKP